MKKILITGVSGLLGNNLAVYFNKKYKVVGTYYNHPVAISGVEIYGLDLCDYVETRELICRINPDIVINCASRTDVDKIEEEREEAWQANVLTTQVLLDALRDFRGKLVHISTDSVYAGKGGPHNECMETNPCNWYGETKLESERLVSVHKDALILRTNLYGWNIQGKLSLAEWFLKRLQAGERTMGFSNALCSSIYTFSLAPIIAKSIERGLNGIYNCGCRDAWSKFQFGQELAEIFGFEPSLIIPTTLEKVGLKAKRGEDLRLDVSCLEGDLKELLPTMSESLGLFFSDYSRQVPAAIRQGNAYRPKCRFYPLREEISYGGQALDHADIDAVVKILKSPYLTQGHEVCRFEEEIAAYVGARYGIAVSSGTAALHLACLACGLVPGEEGVTSPNTFVASANAIVYCGATPSFADIDPKTYNMSAVELEKKISNKTRVVIPVHFAGQSCDMKAIRDVVRAKEKQYGHKIFIIEDASHALGSKYLGRRVGCCEYSDVVVFSFHPVKHITTGEGGMLVTEDHTIAKRTIKLRSHGIVKDPACLHQNPGPWYYEQDELGWNYRITDIQCGLGRSQLKKLDWYSERRRMIVREYNRSFATLPHVSLPREAPECESNFHLYVLQIDFNALGLSRSGLMDSLKKEKILTQVHYIPVHLQPYYRRNFGQKEGTHPIAEAYYKKCLSLPLYPAMDEEDVSKVISHVCDILRIEKVD